VNPTRTTDRRDCTKGASILALLALVAGCGGADGERDAVALHSRNDRGPCLQRGRRDAGRLQFRRRTVQRWRRADRPALHVNNNAAVGDVSVATAAASLPCGIGGYSNYGTPFSGTGGCFAEPVGWGQDGNVWARQVLRPAAPTSAQPPPDPTFHRPFGRGARPMPA
jgi:hypothetical protein